MSLKRTYGQAETRADRFALFLHAMGRSAATVRAYRAVVSRFEQVRLPPEPDADPVLLYLGQRRDKVAQSSLNLEISALKTWFRWLAVADPEAWQPARWPTQRRSPRRLVRVLSDAEVGRLLAAPDLSTFIGLRDHFAMATLYQCGLRAGELVSLELGSVRLDGYLYVRGKGGIDRLVPFGGAWEGLLESYLRMRATVRPGKRSALLLTRRGRGLRDARSIWVIVNRYARAALGMACGYTRLERTARATPWQGHYPHLLRASFATELHRNGTDLLAISKMLGHASVETTARYIGVDMATLREAISHHPRASLISNR